ncbi:hypothetical protein [Streptococcus pseudoporcinus]|uniref:Lipoprotein n=1 Tax=Streptococcus pseudoporcinus TaxID=361101 RepID=A0A4U9XI86_9STRE|nr:hypothetical protein [Streptococcus pseudoporcinus]VTS12676.1 Uncharacterised protein [Streptococcus pseudoporcinus]VUC65353.1 Uncharacterised protein [Streptococcus pseudoporcinus]VUC96213.1 Uncharacterised protein [Streptococcus pseudoporcinus]VUC96609.1 Uncharacterised protein [Streptococcus pseudoporcinus]
MKTRKKSIYLSLTALLITGAVLTACTEVSKNKGTSIKTEQQVAKKQNFSTYVDQVSELVKLNWPSMDKVWPTYNYKKHNFLIFYLNKEGNVKEARLLNVKENRKLKKEEYEQIPAPTPEGYISVKFQDKQSIAMSVDDRVMEAKDSVQELYKTATHEMVHFYYQGGIKLSNNAGRNQLYPIEIEPRVVRSMLYNRLIQAFENPEKQKDYLAKAKYWLEKYHAEFKKEADSIRITDIAEGTAKYTESLGSFIGKNLSKADSRNEAGKLIQKDKIFIGADRESYEIGYVAALILDDKDPKWKDSFYSKNKGIDEVLLEDVSAVPDRPDEKIEKRITKKIEKTNKNIKVKLKDIIAASKDKTIPFLHLDVSKGSKSFIAEQMFSYQNMPVMSGYTNRFNVNNKVIEIKNVTILSGYNQVKQYIRIPLTGKYEVKNGKMTVKSASLDIPGIPVKVSTENGRTIYSAETQD